MTAAVAAPPLARLATRVRVATPGRASIQLSLRNPDGSPVTGEVALRWYGPDATADTKDDALTRYTVAGGALEASGLPTGRYAVERSGPRARSKPFTLTSGSQSVSRVVPRVDPFAPPTGVRPDTGDGSSTGSLPHTGASELATVLAWALSFVIAGVVLTSAGRRGRARREQRACGFGAL